MRRALAAAALVLALVAPSADADGDPASDILLRQDSFLPYTPETREKLKTALEDVLKAAREAGYPMKVALIQSASDLGSYPNLFNRPQDYANLLSGELRSLNPHGDPLKELHLLVVMPGGYGGTNLGDKVDEALGTVEIQAEAQSDGLAKAAIGAVARIATLNGRPVETPPEANMELAASDAEGGGGPSPLVYIVPVVLVFVGLLTMSWRARRSAR